MMMMILATTLVSRAQPDVEVAASSSSKKEILGLNFFFGFLTMGCWLLWGLLLWDGWLADWTKADKG
jgi:hypothetical protein